MKIHLFPQIFRFIRIWVLRMSMLYVLPFCVSKILILNIFKVPSPSFIVKLKKVGEKWFPCNLHISFRQHCTLGPLCRAAQISCTIFVLSTSLVFLALYPELSCNSCSPAAFFFFSYPVFPHRPLLCFLLPPCPCGFYSLNSPHFFDITPPSPPFLLSHSILSRASFSVLLILLSPLLDSRS